MNSEDCDMQQPLTRSTHSHAFPLTYPSPFSRSSKTTPVQELLVMVDMDLGRYADILLDTILDNLTFTFRNYSWMLFLSMA